MVIIILDDYIPVININNKIIPFEVTPAENWNVIIFDY